MFTFDTPTIDEFDKTVTLFIETLSGNGQILYEFQNMVKSETHSEYRVTAPELDSLEEKYLNTYCRKFYQEVVNKSIKKPILKYIGENYDVPNCCICENSSHFILPLEYETVISAPLLCGDCFLAVPLYRFPKTYRKKEYYDLLTWSSIYEGCQEQFIQGIGEHFVYKMMNNPRSFLSKEEIQYDFVCPARRIVSDGW